MDSWVLEPSWVGSQRTEISLARKRERLYFWFSMFGFGPLEFNFPAFPILDP